MKTQEFVFKSWKNVCIELSELSSFFQNDFEMMLKDGYTTKEELSKMKQEFEERFYHKIGSLKILKDQIIKLMEDE
jgi:hypothetical protein